MDEFCGSPFWDLDLSWYTEKSVNAAPDLTPCFQNTVLVWIPCLFLWIFTILNLICHFGSKGNSDSTLVVEGTDDESHSYNNGSKNPPKVRIVQSSLPETAKRRSRSRDCNKISWNTFNVTKVVICVMLIVTQVARLGGTLKLMLVNNYIVYPVDVYTPVLIATTYALAIFSIVTSMKKGIRSSILQFAFWLLLAICQTVKFRSTFLRAYQNGDTSSSRFDMRSLKMEVILEFIEYPLILGQFLLHCWADSRDVNISSKTRTKTNQFDSEKPKECPEHSASALSRLLFSWFDSLAWKGYKKSLVPKDLWDLNPEDTSEVVNSLFDTNWKRKQLKNSKSAPQSQSSMRQPKRRVGALSVLFSAFGGYFVAGSALKLIPDLLAFASPQVLSLLIAFMSSDDDSWKGYFYATLLLAAALISTLVSAQYNHAMFITGVRVKTALTSALYKKSLVVSNSGKQESTSGEIVNLMSVDINNILFVLPFINFLWSGPLQISISLYFLWGILGPSVLAGLGVVLLLIPTNLFIGRLLRGYQINQMKYKDERVRLVSEILSGIKILKLYAWEPSFQDEVMKIREKEIKTLKGFAYITAIYDFLFSCSTFMVALTTFATYVLVDESNVLNAQNVFVSLSLLNVMAFPLTVLPRVAVYAIQAGVSMGRINKFLNAEEIDTTAVSHHESEADPIIIEDGCFSWDARQKEVAAVTNDTSTCGENVLKNINMRVKEGSLVAIVGPVGSGKSSLLSAILGELEKTSGRLNTKGSTSYVAQQAWIQNATMRENILFGKPYDARFYNKVVEACALGPDLDIFPARDKIEIGEKGVNLSGGQKQRVSIARAVYNNSELYLLDDPLSAVDSHVGKHIFDKVLSSKGLLRRKTRVLVTNALHFLHQVDHIIVLKNGVVSQTGTYEKLVAEKGEFAELISQYTNNVEDDPPEETTLINSKLQEEQLQWKQSIEKSNVLDSSGDGRKSSIRSRTVSQTEQNDVEQEKLIGVETMETQGVKWLIYFDYLRAAGMGSVILSLLMFGSYQAIAILSNFWLAHWSNEPIVNGTQGNRYLYLGVYAGLGMTQSLSFMLGTALLCLAIIRAASVYHFNMLERILRAPMSFFDTTPTGRIVNRFSKDIDVLDTTLSQTIRLGLRQATNVIGTLVVIMYNTPIFIAAIIPIAIFYYLVQKFYIPSSRQLKRLESVTRSPIYSLFGETITGAPTIRAYGQQHRFISESDVIVDRNQICYYPSLVATRWLEVRLQMTGGFIIFFAALFTVVGRESLSPGLVGLTVTYALQITNSLSLLVRAACDVEANIVGVERVKEYGEVPQEAPWTSELRKPAKTWPAEGSVQFKNFQTRYREGMDLVLKNVTCNIEPGEKIGVVGRTGAGKSSLTLALFRIIEGVNEGTITVDGEDIKKLGLHDVRSRLTIIPQDPVLFSGTLRFNLDPFGKYSDNAVWRALELSYLKALVEGLQGSLEFKVSEGGDNLSVGQKQLVCLARALLRKSKILVLDEATAAIDLETDDLIQKTIRTEFKDSTVITIAHRLNTIMDSTKIMVIDSGSIREFDSPGKLLENTESQFYAMVNAAGLISVADVQ